MNASVRHGRLRLPVFYSVLALGMLTVAGCSKSNSPFPVARLEGTFAIDGVPVPEGSVQFQPMGSGQPGSGTVVNGHYVAERAPIGKVRVLFTALRETGKVVREGTHEFPERVDLVPARFRAGVDIDVVGDNSQLDFVLNSR